MLDDSDESKDMPPVDSVQALLADDVDLFDRQTEYGVRPKTCWGGTVIGRIGHGGPGMLSLQAVHRRR